MDRFTEMAVFVAVTEAGSFAGAARRLRRSPAAVTRLIGALEARLGIGLLQRTTRSLRLTEAGERFAAAARQVLGALDEAERAAAGEGGAPQGLLTVTAPLVFGRRHVRPALDDFLDENPSVRARLVLLDRIVSLIDEGIDIGVRIGPLPDSSLVALKVGEVRRVVCASPAYLASHALPATPADLRDHARIGFSDDPGAPWAFVVDGRPFAVASEPRLSVNSAEAAIASAAEGRGITRVLSYQVQDAVARGDLALVLEAFEPEPLPVHVVQPAGRLPAAKTRRFIDHLAPRLRRVLKGGLARPSVGSPERGVTAPRRA